DHPPLALERLRAAINLDMIGRGEPGEIFCEGGAASPWLRGLSDKANLEVGLQVRHDEHPEWARGSDHYPFMKRSVPTLYFGVEDHEDYHKVSDHADLIVPELCAAVARLVFWITLEAAAAPVTGEDS
ncbi:MAG: Zn-dependent M28 family amino/carboxypeptidase, partial [Pseudohongiellaceae bacterium]